MTATDDPDKSQINPPQLPDSETIGRELVRSGALTKRQLSRVVAMQQRNGVSFREAAESMNLVKREDLMRALSQRFNYPILDKQQTKQRFSPELVVGHEPFSPAAEAIRSIRTQIAVSAIAAGTRAFAVIGPREGTGASYLVANLGVAFAQMTIPTLIVDANLRNPRLADLFGAPPQSEGLSDFLMQRDQRLPPIRSEVIPNLSVLTAGSIPPNPQELLSTPEFLALVNTINTEFGVVIFDTAPALDFSDALVVASRVGAAIVVARRHRSKFQELQSLTKQLSALQCNVVGSVMNTF